MTEIERQNDPHWETFQYVAGELPLAQQQDFETRLESDQALRQQVAKMVSGLAIVADELQPIVSLRSTAMENDREPQATFWRPVRRVFLGVAALIAIGTLAIALTNRTEDMATDSIAVAWADSLEEESFQEFDVDVDFAVDVDFDEYELAAIEPTVGLESDDESDWIFDAIVAVEAMKN